MAARRSRSRRGSTPVAETPERDGSTSPIVASAAASASVTRVQPETSGPSDRLPAENFDAEPESSDIPASAQVPLSACLDTSPLRRFLSSVPALDVHEPVQNALARIADHAKLTRHKSAMDGLRAVLAQAFNYNGHSGPLAASIVTAMSPLREANTFDYTTDLFRAMDVDPASKDTAQCVFRTVRLVIADLGRRGQPVTAAGLAWRLGEPLVAARPSTSGAPPPARGLQVAPQQRGPALAGGVSAHKQLALVRHLAPEAGLATGSTLVQVLTTMAGNCTLSSSLKV